MRTLASVLAGVILALLVLMLVVRRARSGLARRQVTHLAGRTPLRIDRWANLFGVASRGYRQLRGNGALVLTRDDLWFGMLLPPRDLTVPLERITLVDEADSHLGKRTFAQRLLRVEFEGDEGPDAAAWAVRDSAGWVEAVRDALTARGH